jgi:hypothetical protein
MRNIKFIVFHCSATREGQSVTAAEIDRWHRQRGFAKIGYQRFVRLNGMIETGRSDEEIGAGVAGWNANSIHICYAGGLAVDGVTPKDTRTPQQKTALRQLALDYHRLYPDAKICGHRDMSPDADHDGVVEPQEWLKACPSFDVHAWLDEIGIGEAALVGPAK